ncbi:hypothetical protein [Micromonospora costi]|uniref:Uncharacterized protein n=1 Tax=Micromonospora costi TaxID=1530042 RepID=A0A3A9ZRE1_9ACTN|nr:hypothetical protein [Micromonospora costi]RKN50017.1 hypothetical protein D7193_30845 [Micromonospora costi]
MPVVAALALTLALAPAPAPSPTPSAGPVGSLLGGVGSLVDGLLGAGGGGTPTPTPTPTSPTAGPSVTAVPSSAPVVPPAGTPSGVPTSAPAGVPGPPGAPGPAGPRGGLGDPVVVVTGTPPPAVGVPGDPTTSQGLAAPAAVQPDPLMRWAAMMLAVGVLAVPVALIVRRRRPAVAPSPATPSTGGAPVPPAEVDETSGNVTRLPTNLNAIYELGRLDERLAQERERRS